jgi:hypothetical protein
VGKPNLLIALFIAFPEIVTWLPDKMFKHQEEAEKFGFAGGLTC